MKIRSHLLILVLSTLLPILALSVIISIIFWREQRWALEQRYLERVRAISVALDRELEGHIRALQIFAESPALKTGDFRSFYDQAVRVRERQHNWVNLIVNDPRSGRQVLNLRRPFDAPPVETTADPATLERVVTSGRALITPIMKGRVSGEYATTVIVPAKTDNGQNYTLVAVIRQLAWLRFLLSYPVAPDATMTLLDQNGVIIARTLNNERWVGKRPAPALYELSRKSPEGAYKSVGLEGQLFYSAHSRSKIAGWTVATGVPAPAVEAILWSSIMTMAVAFLCAATLALLLAYRFGRGIIHSFESLGHSAGALISGTPLPAHSVVHVKEASDVARAFQEAAAQLKAQDAALRESQHKLRLQAEELEKQLIASGRLVSLGELTASIAHEFNNPLGIVMGFAQDLMSEKNPSDPDFEPLRIMYVEAERCAKIVKQLLEFPRPRSAELSVTSIASIVEQVLALTRARLYESKIETITKFQEEPLDVMADPVQLQQVLINLFLNAMDAMPNGGNLALEVMSHRGIDAADQPEVLIKVSDTGSGMDETVLPHIFQPFFSANKKSGLGLGLAVSERIIKNHRGRIAVESAPGEGTTFKIYLPSVESAAGKPASPIADAGSRSTATE
jgi:signal transduction histidine kinase